MSNAQEYANTRRAMDIVGINLNEQEVIFGHWLEYFKALQDSIVTIVSSRLVVLFLERLIIGIQSLWF